MDFYSGSIAIIYLQKHEGPLCADFCLYLALLKRLLHAMRYSVKLIQAFPAF